MAQGRTYPGLDNSGHNVVGSYIVGTPFPPFCLASAAELDVKKGLQNRAYKSTSPRVYLTRYTLPSCAINSTRSLQLPTFWESKKRRKKEPLYGCRDEVGQGESWVACATGFNKIHLMRGKKIQDVNDHDRRDIKEKKKMQKEKHWKAIFVEKQASIFGESLESDLLLTD